MTSIISGPFKNEVFRPPTVTDDGPIPIPPGIFFFVLSEVGNRVILENGSGFVLTEAAP